MAAGLSGRPWMMTQLLHGLATAHVQGRLGGRPKALDIDRRQLAVEFYQQKKLPIGKICDTMGITRSTLYKYVRENQEETATS